MPRRARPVRPVLMLPVVALLLGACGGGGEQPTAPLTAGTTPSATAAPEPEQTATETPTATPTASATEAPSADGVELTADGVGAVVYGEPDAEARLVALLGEPTERRDGDWYSDCGSGENSALLWDDLVVELDGMGSSLYGWHLKGAAVPDGVVVPFGIVPGDLVSQVTEVTGVEPVEREGYDIWVVAADGLQWWTESGEPTAPVIVAGSDIITCD